MTGAVVLPKGIAHWEKQLAIFPEDVALALGALAARLAIVLDLPGTQRSRRDEPDGFAGLSRRGSYERLLLSEWLLQEELPDEFIRRAMAGEHSFLERAHRSDAAASRAVVLFDVGSDQLGGPRVVQLAVLITLARRAEAAGQSFAWGIVQDENATLHEGVTESGVRGFVTHRSIRRSTAADVTRWRAALGARVWSERWLVGGDRLEEFAAELEAHRVAISEVLELESTNRVQARVFHRGTARPRETTLVLPPARTAVQILRDPLAASATRQTPSGRLAPSSPLLFSPDGRRLWAIGERGELVTIQVPNSPRAAQGQVTATRLGDSGSIVAVGQARSKKRTVAVTWDDHHHVLHVLSKRGHVVTQSIPLRAPAGYSLRSSGLRPLGVVDVDHVLWMDGDGALVEAMAGELVIRGDFKAIASRPLPKGLALIAREPRPPHVVAARARTRAPAELERNGVQLLAPTLASEAFFGDARDADVFVYRRSEKTWTLVRRQESTHVQIPDGAVCVGCVERLSPTVQTFVVVLLAGRTRIALMASRIQEVVVETTTPIVSLTVSDVSRDIVYLTEAGELGIFSVTLGKVVLCLAGVAGP